MSKDRPTPTEHDDELPTSDILDPALRVEVLRSDGTREYVSLVDAIDVYERRHAAALDEIEHCEKRIAELRQKWNRALKGRVLPSGTPGAYQCAPAAASPG